MNNNLERVNLTLNKLFEKQVDKIPDNVAFIYNKLHLNYQELNIRANKLANYLLANHKLDNNCLLVLCLKQDEYMLIAILASLKAGVAYAPVDQNYPEDRLDYIFQDTMTKIILTNDSYLSILENMQSIKKHIMKPTFIPIDSNMLHSQIYKYSEKNPEVNINTDDLAYVIYTSGTTGVPKGVMIEHKGIVNLITNQIQMFQLKNSVGTKNNEVKHCLWFANYVFDAHVWDVFATLCTGNTLHMVDDEVRQSIDRLAEYVAAKKIYMATIPPALLDTNTLLTLQYLIVAGEKTEQKVFEYYRTNNVCIINAYSPTETTVCSHFHIFNEGNGNVIGKPLQNVSSYVLNDNLQQVVENEVGELYIGGLGVARGYLKQPGLTTEKFITNPLQTDEEKSLSINNRLYKTGDFVKLLPGGELEYIERRDHQVKINGYRIDLGEIESQLSNYPRIQQSLVQLVESHKTKIKYLIAYYVAPEPLDSKELSNYLSNKLLVHMIPNQFIHLIKFPLTINGKIDKKSLPLPEIDSDNGLQPRNSVEQMVCREFADVLGLEYEQLNLDSDFIQLGGNSILAGRIVAKLNNYFDSNLQIAAILTIRKIGYIYDAIILKKNKYHCLVKLNWAQNKPLLFMIHDGLGGCELYTGLANKLNSSFSCYGVDNYNLYHKNKIDSMNELANMYLTNIMQVMQDNKQQHYFLFGVCLGGVIATYIAVLLEKMGITNITIVSWDSVIPDQHLGIIRKQNSIGSIKSVMLNAYNDLSENFVDKVLAAVEANINLLNTKFNNQLLHTKILLFKALFVEDGIDIFKPEYEYICSLPYNNFDYIQHDISKICKIELTDIKHSGFLSQTEFIAQNMLTML